MKNEEGTGVKRGKLGVEPSALHSCFTAIILGRLVWPQKDSGSHECGASLQLEIVGYCYSTLQLRLGSTSKLGFDLWLSLSATGKLPQPVREIGLPMSNLQCAPLRWCWVSRRSVPWMVWRSQQQWVVDRAAQRWSVSWLGCWVCAFLLFSCVCELVC